MKIELRGRETILLTNQDINDYHFVEVKKNDKEKKQGKYVCDCEHLDVFKKVEANKEGICNKCGYYAMWLTEEETRGRPRSEEKILNRYKDIISYKKQKLKLKQIASELGISYNTLNDMVYFKKSYEKYRPLVNDKYPEYKKTVIGKYTKKGDK